MPSSQLREFSPERPRDDRIIMLVEDNPDDEELTLRALRKNNIANEVVVARDGAEALDYLFATGAYHARSPRALPDVILLDLKLPKLDGLEVLRRLRVHPLTELVPVVILTSSREDHDLVSSYRLGANSYIRKPVDFTQFLESLRLLGLYWLVINEPPPRGASA
ncbi:MAG: response regulator [Pseudomonadota bacterium]